MIFEYHLKDSEERDHLDIVEEGVGAACAKALWQEGAWDRSQIIMPNYRQCQGCWFVDGTQTDF